MNLTSVERSILVTLLLSGDDKPSNISKKSDFTRSAVARRCNNLEEEGLIYEKGGGIYTLTNAGVQVAQNLARDEYL